jgi:hypothetical protein
MPEDDNNKLIPPTDEREPLLSQDQRPGYNTSHTSQPNDIEDSASPRIREEEEERLIAETMKGGEEPEGTSLGKKIFYGMLVLLVIAFIWIIAQGSSGDKDTEVRHLFQP